MKSYLKSLISIKKLKFVWLFEQRERNKKIRCNTAKNVSFLQNALIRKKEIIKTLSEIQTSILDIVSNSSKEKEEEGIAPTRNEIIKEI